MTRALIIPEIVDLPLDMLSGLEDRIDKGLASFVDVGDSLKVIQDGRLWRGQYSSFQDYASSRWGLRRSSTYAYITAANVVHSLGDVQPSGLTYSQALKMVPLSREQRVEVAQKVDFTTTTRDDVDLIVKKTIASEKRPPPKVPSRPPRGTAIIRTLEQLRPECADLLILAKPSDPPILTEVGQFLRPGCSLLVPFQTPMLLFSGDPSFKMLGILGIVRSQQAIHGPVIVEQDYFGWFSRSDYVGGRCSNRLASLADVVGVVTWGGDTIVEIGATSRSVLDATVLADRHYVGVHPSAMVAEAIRVHELEG